MEDNPHNTMASYLIGDFLFGNNQDDVSQDWNLDLHITSME